MKRFPIVLFSLFILFVFPARAELAPEYTFGDGTTEEGVQAPNDGGISTDEGYESPMPEPAAMPAPVSVSEERAVMPAPVLGVISSQQAIQNRAAIARETFMPTAGVVPTQTAAPRTLISRGTVATRGMPAGAGTVTARPGMNMMPGSAAMPMAASRASGAPGAAPMVISRATPAGGGLTGRPGVAMTGVTARPAIAPVTSRAAAPLSANVVNARAMGNMAPAVANRRVSAGAPGMASRVATVQLKQIQLEVAPVQTSVPAWCTAGTGLTNNVGGSGTACSQCKAGYYSASTTTTPPSGSGGGQTPIPTPAPTPTPTPTPTSCPAGQGLNDNTGGSSTTCSTCNAGFYSTDTGTKCTACLSGVGFKYTTPGAGTTNASDCVIGCAKNTYVKTANTGCVACPDGQTSDAQAVKIGQTSTCTPTSGGDNSGGTAADDSTLLRSSTDNSGGNPTSCPKDQYMENGTCKACPSGYTAPAGSVKESNCTIKCDAGKHVAYIFDTCTDCPSDQTAPAQTVMAGYASPCSSGNTSGNANYQATPEKLLNKSSCPAGWYKDGNDCTRCGAGMVSPAGSVGSSSCATAMAQKDCPPGYSFYGYPSRPDMNYCYITCPANTYVEFVWGPCQACPAGTSSTARTIALGLMVDGISGISFCTKDTDTGGGTVATGCNEGYYLYNGKECRACKTGYSAPAGSTSEGSCKVTCPLNTYVPVAGNGCVSCPADKPFSPGGAFAQTVANSSICRAKTSCTAGQYFDSTQSQCASCPSGYTSPDGATDIKSCTITCDAAHHVASPNGKCEVCVTGQSDGQPVPSGATSACKAATASCPANQYLSGGACVACPDGYKSPDGYTDKGMCKISCPANTYVSTPDGPCVPCEGTQMSMAQPVSAGTTSSCTGTGQNMIGVATCAANYYVTYNTAANGWVCIACPDGYTSPGGSKQASDCTISCPEGTHVAERGGTCVACPDGQTSDANTVSYLYGTSSCHAGTAPGVTPTSCLRGQGLTNNVSGTAGCAACKADYYNDGSTTTDGTTIFKATDCRPCPAGYSTNGTTGVGYLSQCIISCPVNYYVYPAGTQCQKCPDGTGSRGVTVGATDWQQCRPLSELPPGYDQPATPTPSACPAGQGNAIEIQPSPGGANTSDWGTCKICPQGYYSDGSDSVCRKCGGFMLWTNPLSASQTTEGEGSTSARQCMPGCPAGNRMISQVENLSNGQTTYSCQTCAAGTWAANGNTGNCTPCDAGWTTSGAGSTKATDCSVQSAGAVPFGTSCPANATVNATLCPKGSTTRNGNWGCMTTDYCVCNGNTYSKGRGTPVVPADSLTQTPLPAPYNPPAYPDFKTGSMSVFVMSSDRTSCDFHLCPFGGVADPTCVGKSAEVGTNLGCFDNQCRCAWGRVMTVGGRAVCIREQGGGETSYAYYYLYGYNNQLGWGWYGVNGNSILPNQDFSCASGNGATNNTVADGACAACKQGFYSGGGSNAGCIACPPGTTTAGTSSTSASDCK